MSWPEEKIDIIASKAKAESVSQKTQNFPSFLCNQEFSIVGKLRFAFQFVKKAVHKKLTPYLKTLKLFAKNKNLNDAKFDEGNAAVIDSRENYRKRMMGISNNNSAIKLSAQSCCSDKKIVYSC